MLSRSRRRITFQQGDYIRFNRETELLLGRLDLVFIHEDFQRIRQLFARVELLRPKFDRARVPIKDSVLDLEYFEETGNIEIVSLPAINKKK